MQKITENLYVGTVEDLLDVGKRTVSLSHKYHYSLHNNKITPQHKCYLFHYAPEFLSVNLVDGEARYFDYKGEGSKNFSQILDFIEESTLPVLVVCDKAESRSPSIVLLYLAKRLHLIPDTDYFTARAHFQRLYSSYKPSKGIAEFLTVNWHNIH